MSTTAIVPGSLGQIAKVSGVSLAETFTACEHIILVDVSGSMSDHDAPGGVSRYDAALRELAAIQARRPGKIGVLAFSTGVQFVPSGQPYLDGGGTNLAGALTFAKLADTGDIDFVVISDGQPDSQSEALAVAAQYKGAINTVYVGPERDNGARDFLNRLALAGRGKTAVATCTQFLANKIDHLLLAA